MQAQLVRQFPCSHSLGWFFLNVLLKSKISFSSLVVSALYLSAFHYSSDVPVAGHVIKKEVHLAQFQMLET